MKIDKNIFIFLLWLTISSSFLEAIEGEIWQEEQPKGPSELENEQKSLKKQQENLEKEQLEEEKNLEEKEKEAKEYYSNISEYKLGSKQYFEVQSKLIENQSETDRSRQKLGINEEKQKFIKQKLNFIKEQLTEGYEPSFAPETPEGKISKFISNVKKFLNNFIEKTKDIIRRWLGTTQEKEELVPNFIQATKDVAKKEAMMQMQGEKVESWEKLQDLRKAASPKNKYGKLLAKLKKAENNLISSLNNDLKSDLNGRIQEWGKRFNQEISQAQSVKDLKSVQSTIQRIIDDPKDYFKDFQQKVDSDKLYIVIFNEENPFTELDLENNASSDEIRKTYKKLALKWHPDKWVDKPKEQQNQAEETFKKIGAAYEVLSDPIIRFQLNTKLNMIDNLQTTFNQTIDQASSEFTKFLSGLLKATQARVNKLQAQPTSNGSPPSQ